MQQKKKGAKPIYETSLKIAVARDYLASDLSSTELMVKYNLPYADCAHYFVRWYKRHYPQTLPQQQHDIIPVVDSSPSDQALSNQLKEANLKIAGLEMMIEIAQKELGIDIVKKPGTKQSSK
jgi:hypothetical protein